MSKFYIDYLSSSDLEKDKRIVRLKDCVELIEKSEFRSELVKLYDFENIENDFFTISGLKLILDSIISRDKLYEKIDIVSHISKVEFIQKTDSNNIILRISDVADENIDTDYIDVETAYSSKRDYFDGFYKMDKFADFCIKEGHFDLIKTNIDYLNHKHTDTSYFEKSFRLLRDDEKKYYLRAITSTSRYYDYNIRFSLFVTLISIYKIIKNSNSSFSIDYCEYSESFIRIYFKKMDGIPISNIGTLYFALEMTNDEIKREAFKFSGVFTLKTESNHRKINLQFKPRRLKTPLLTIQHNFLPSTVVSSLEYLSNYIEKVESEMKEDIENISHINNPDKLRFFLLRKIERSTNNDLIKYKKGIRKTLDVKINKINELFILMDSVNNLVIEFELKEYLRYLYYDIIRDEIDK